MKKGFPISRNVRAQWMIEHLDTLITIQSPSLKNKEAPELEVVSVLPKTKVESWSSETSHQYLYRVTSTTSITFLAHKYRMVFNLDLSPSLATIVSIYENMIRNTDSVVTLHCNVLLQDIQHGEIVIDEVYIATKRFLENIIKPVNIDLFFYK